MACAKNSSTNFLACRLFSLFSLVENVDAPPYSGIPLATPLLLMNQKVALKQMPL